MRLTEQIFCSSAGRMLFTHSAKLQLRFHVVKQHPHFTHSEGLKWRGGDVSDKPMTLPVHCWWGLLIGWGMSTAGPGKGSFRWRGLALRYITDCFSAFLHRMLVFLMFALECTQYIEVMQPPQSCAASKSEAIYALHAGCPIFMVINLLLYESHCSSLMCCKLLSRQIFSILLSVPYI